MTMTMTMKLSVCIDALYNGKDFAESVREVQAIGYDTIEFWMWWEKDLDAVSKVIRETGVSVSCFCTKFISLVDSSKRSEYIRGLEESIAAAKLLGCSKLISLVGQEIEGVAREQQRQSIIDGLKECVPMLEREGITLLVEPLNRLVDHKGYFLNSSAEAFGIVREIGSENVKVLYDIYHQQVTEGHLIAAIKENVEHIGYFHAAGNPGRHELSLGELNYKEIFAAIHETAYDGCIGLEYFPRSQPDEGLLEVRSWFKAR